MASQDNYHPFKFDSTIGEYYLPIPCHHSNLRLTPYRPDSDGDVQILHLNNPLVYQNISGPPFPFLREHAEEWNTNELARSLELLNALGRGEKYVDGCPVRAIREVQEDGSQILIGDIQVGREANEAPWLTEDEKNNDSKPAGDPTIVWSLGCEFIASLRDSCPLMMILLDYLEPGHHRRGIMRLVISTLINDWMIPRMNCHRIAGTVFIGNRASEKVLLNNGFVQQEDAPDWERIPEGRGGGTVGLHVYRWSLPESREPPEPNE
jgi:RimJ/RimL family protein N-acetyltransferase